MTPKNVQRPVQGDLGAEVKYLSELIEDIESILKGKKTMESMIDALQQIVISLGRTEVRVDRDIQEEGIKLQRYLSQLPQKDPEYDKGKKIIEALGAERAVLGRALSRYTGTVAKDVRGSTQKMAWVKILKNRHTPYASKPHGKNCHAVFYLSHKAGRTYGRVGKEWVRLPYREETFRVYDAIVRGGNPEAVLSNPQLTAGILEFLCSPDERWGKRESDGRIVALSHYRNEVGGFSSL